MEKCKEEVWHGYSSSRCSRNAKRDGYCTQHHPETKAERKRKQAARWEFMRDRKRAEREARALRDRKAAALDELLDGLEGLASSVASTWVCEEIAKLTKSARSACASGEEE